LEIFVNTGGRDSISAITRNNQVKSTAL